MRPSRTTLALAVAALLAAACGSRRIPGTDIKDTTDTRAVYALIDQYRAATERRDAPAVLALVSKKYFDDAGTPDPSDDVDYGLLKTRLGDDLAKVTALRLEISVKQVEVENDRAAAYVYYDEHYRIATRGGEIAKNASDPHRMVFLREEGTWKIAGGL
jgi:ketosteroid isomerase-like protein